jgi:hypothetical protein
MPTCGVAERGAGGGSGGGATGELWEDVGRPLSVVILAAEEVKFATCVEGAGNDSNGYLESHPWRNAATPHPESDECRPGFRDDGSAGSQGTILGGTGNGRDLLPQRDSPTLSYTG